jgi:RNA polymerase sigma-70 factor (ECF subfamily)
MGAVSRSLAVPIPALAPPASREASAPRKARTEANRQHDAELAAKTQASEPLSGDAALLAALRAGDFQALDEVVREHQGVVYAYLRARLLEPADAEDLAQETFLRCCDGSVEFERAAGLRSWLIGIARNVLREHLRGQSKREQLWGELCLEVDSLTPRDEQAAETALDHLPDCLESLGQSAREALDMRYGGERSFTDIGRHLHRSEGAVKLLMFRARQALKNCLDHKLQAQRHA